MWNIPELNYSRSQNIQKRSREGKGKEKREGSGRGREKGRGDLLRKKSKEVQFKSSSQPVKSTDECLKEMPMADLPSPPGFTVVCS